MQRHLSSDIPQTLHQEVGRTHTGLDRAEGMLDRLAPRPHGVGIGVEPSLDLLDHMLVLPARDATLL